MQVNSELSFHKDLLPLVYKPGLTNNIFTSQEQHRVIHYIPAYLRLKVKNIISMDLFTLCGEINCAMILSVYYGNLDQELVKHLSQNMEIVFHKSQVLKLKDDDLQVDRKDQKEKRLMSFTIRKSIFARLEADIFWSPFEVVNFIITTTLRSISIFHKGKKHILKFNLMDCEDQNTKFSLAQQGRFGMFRIAQNMLQVEYTNQFAYSKTTHAQRGKKRRNIAEKIGISKTTIQRKVSRPLVQLDQQQVFITQGSIENFHYAHFILPVYRKPMATVLTIYFPLILLGIINIGIFYQDNQQTGKQMLNIGALMVSFIALIPTVRQQTAVSPMVTFTEIIVFLQAFTTILTVIHMIQYRQQEQYEYDLANDGYGITCVVITSIAAMCIFVLIILHKTLWKSKYHGNKQFGKSFKFDHTKWENKACDIYFSQIEQFDKLDFGQTMQQISSKKKSKKKMLQIEAQ